MEDILKDIDSFEKTCRKKMNESDNETNQLKWAAHIISLIREKSEIKREITRLKYMIPYNTDNMYN